jgi:hypothetical protein
LTPLVFNPQLDRMAKIQAENMARFQKMSHTIPDASLPTLTDRARYVGYRYRRVAENVALGYPNAETVVEGRMSRVTSPEHSRSWEGCGDRNRIAESVALAGSTSLPGVRAIVLDAGCGPVVDPQLVSQSAVSRRSAVPLVRSPDPGNARLASPFPTT